ncbi:K02A2.6-like [Cordylochernes scorpioides]|uniref:K02A2.6-like n=1 Tax=Cordylochernes scorpioides TaxID=51811 RepID=A0ABY6K8J4_9ARAC|nr:K02A2.6-like [Cordylochernes scorpioides]
MVSNVFALIGTTPTVVHVLSPSSDPVIDSTPPRVVNGIGKKREAESNGQKFQVDRPRPVRTPATVSKVKRLATTENPPSQRQLSRMCGTSLKTINNIIHKDLELDTRRKGKVHKLTPFHMKNRATNARKLYEEHLAGSRSEYTATLDEAWMYVTYCNEIRKICYIKRGNQVPDNWVHQCSETFPKGFMVVGVMTGRGVLPLIKVPSKVKVNSEFYIECVLKPVIEQLKDLYPGEMDKVFLHHDKASSHTSNKTQQFLQEMKDTLGLNFIRNSDIPVKSPDASPLDFYGFGMLKQRLFNRRPKTEAGLWKAAQEEWSNVSLSKVKEVFAAWKVRCREIAKKKGKHIEHMKKIHRCMETSEALHWTQQQQKIDPEQQLYTPKIENIAVIEMETSEALHWTQQQKIDPEQQLYTPKIENIAVIEMKSLRDFPGKSECSELQAARVQEPSEWYKITTQLKLSTNKEEEPQQPSTSTSTPVKRFNSNSSKAHQYQPFPRTAAATHHQQEPYKSINQPPYPCKICASHQLPNQIHFHRDCPLKNNTHPKRINPDASSLGVAGVLKQPDEQGILHPIGYFSRKLHPYEQNYTASEIETLAIINSVQRFHTYLHNIHFTLHTDHLPLKWIKNVKNPQETNAKVERLNSTIINRLRCEYNANLKIPWTKYIPKITESYNETVHTTTGFTPKFLYYGIQPQYIEHDTETHTPIEKARKLAIERTIKSHEHSKQLYDIKHPEPIFKEGDQDPEAPWGVDQEGKRKYPRTTLGTNGVETISVKTVP